MTTAEILEFEFNKLVNELKEGIEAKGMTASGDSARSLEVVINDDSAKILGNSNFEQLEYGRNPTRKNGTDTENLVEKIKKWIENKGIVSNSEKEISVSSLAFLIARKIHREGWDRKGYGGVELVSEIITAERMQDIINKVGVELTATFVQRLQKEIKDNGNSI